jgi:hypothetical protein
VFDRRNGRAAARQAGGQTRIADGAGIGAYFDRRREVGAAKDDAAVCRRRAQFQIDLQPGVQTDPGCADDGAYGSLPDHWKSCDSESRAMILAQRGATFV